MTDAEIVARMRDSVKGCPFQNVYTEMNAGADLIERLQAEKAAMEKLLKQLGCVLDESGNGNHLIPSSAKDAERYRWLRSINGTDEGLDHDSGHSFWDDLLEEDCRDERFDAAIDAAKEPKP